MRKLLLFLCALLVGASGVWAETTYMVTDPVQVTNLANLSSSKYYVLKNCGSNFYNCYDASNSRMDAKTDYDYSCVVKLNYDGANVTIQQVSTGSYYQGLVNEARLSLGVDPVNFTFNTDGVETGQFRFANNGLYMNRSSEGTQYPKGAGTGFTGNYSRWNIYQVTITPIDNMTPSIPGDKYVSVGEKTESFTAATSASDNSHWYILTQVRDGETPMYNVGTGNTLKRTATSITTATINATLATSNLQYLIRFFETGENTGLYKIQFADGDFITSSLATTSSIASAGIYAFYNTNGGSGSYFAWNKDNRSNSIVDNNGAGYTVAFYGSGEVSGTSGNNVWTLYPVTLIDKVVNITYKVLYGDSNTEVASTSVQQVPGASLALPAEISKTFCEYGSFYGTSDLTGDALSAVPAEDATVYVKATPSASCPVVFSTIGSPKWYLIHFGSANKTWYGVNGSTALTITEANQYDATDGYSWAFIGNPYGVKLYNKEAAAYINVGNPSGTGAISNPMNTTDGTVWIMNDGAITGTATDFGLQLPGKNLYVNAWGGGNALGLWSSGTSGDNGSTLRTTDIEVFDHKDFVDQFIQPYIDNPSDAYYAISSAQATSLSETYGKASYSASEYKSYLEALNAAIKKPADGYYVLKNVNTGSYLKMDDVISVGAAKTDADAIIKLTNSGTGFNLQIQGTYIQVPSYNIQVATNSSPAVLYAFAQTPGVIKVGTTEGAHSYMNYTDGIVKGFTPTTNTGWWNLEDAKTVTVNLNSDGAEPATYYATFCAPFSYTVSGATAYTMKENGDYLVPTAVEGEVAAGTPVLLKGTSATATLTIGTGYETTPATGTALTGTYLAATIEGANDYVLGIDGGVVGFYHWDSNNLAANRAYVDTPASVNAYNIDWSGETGINAIGNVQSTNNAVFNLAGQRVQKAQKGLYIVNGKKMLVK